ncbi:hypothetical protein J2X06_003020 [Lysobacter niastensis]|uniref:Uncharacterized protein n=1 Tax=Lysobacter niastensis TaxID=380629 RepID=A0ABU1WE23_9GAMM|nr:hypothetical protein [Lysobacter niastensis]
MSGNGERPFGQPVNMDGVALLALETTHDHYFGV